MHQSFSLKFDSKAMETADYLLAIGDLEALWKVLYIHLLTNMVNL